MRTPPPARLFVALGLFGLVVAAAPSDTGRPSRAESIALARPSSDGPASPAQTIVVPERAAPPAAKPARPVAKPAAARTPNAPPVIRPIRPKHRSPSRASTSHPAKAPPAPKPKPKPKPSPPPSPPPSTGASSAYESRILVLVNAQRASHGLSVLSMSSCADSFAESWAPHLAAIGALVHRSMSTLLSGCHAQYVGENIGFGNVSADTMMAMWMASPDHRANILNPRFTHIGIGAAQTAGGTWYAVQDFLDL